MSRVDPARLEFRIVTCRRKALIRSHYISIRSGTSLPHKSQRLRSEKEGGNWAGKIFPQYYVIEESNMSRRNSALRGG